MQERKKRRIVIASVLKPVDDTRMLEKMGQSMADAYEVHIIGFNSRNTSHSTAITLHPLPLFGRLSIGRITAPWKILRKLLGLRPALLIITTHELLFVALLAKLFLHTKIIYDVRENYARNIKHTDAFPVGLRTVLALYVRFTEWLTKPFIDHFFLAEKGYAHELTFPASRTTILENKYKRSLPIEKKEKASDSFQLIFSGTLAESTGVFTAINLASALHDVDASITLTIIGYCAREETLNKIKHALHDKSYIVLKGGDHLVPHTEILKVIQHADAGIIAYPPNPSTINSIPTKLYEYLGNQLPILLIHHDTWVEICSTFPAAIVFDEKHTRPEKILHGLRNTRFYTNTSASIFWETEEVKLLGVLHTLLG